VSRYIVRPAAERDLDAHADYYAEQEGLELSLRSYEAAANTGVGDQRNGKPG
jgi:plasmid stabilization system protein ParE